MLIRIAAGTLLRIVIITVFVTSSLTSVGDPGFAAGPGARPQDTVTSISLTNATIPVGSTGTTDLMVNGYSGTNGLGAYDVRINFDVSKVIVTAVGAGDSPFNSMPSNNVGTGTGKCNTTGQLAINSFHTTIPGPRGPSFKIARITWQALSLGTHSLTLSVTTLSDTSGSDVTGYSAINGTITALQNNIGVGTVSLPTGAMYNGYVDVYANNIKNPGIGSYNFTIGFDTTKVIINHIIGGTAPFDGFPQNNIGTGSGKCNTTGQLTFSASQPNSTGPTGNVLLARVNLSVLATGTFSLALTVNSLINAQGSNITPITVINGSATGLPLNINVGSVQVPIGTGFNGNVDVYVNNWDDPDGVGSYDLSIAFSIAEVRINSIAGGTAPFGEVTAHNVGTGTGKCNTTGQLNFASYHNQIPGPTGNVWLARINLSNLAAGTHALTLTVNSLYDTAGTSITRVAVNGSVSTLVAPVASFRYSLSPANGIAPCTATFSDTSANSPSSWSWNFGDGTGSSSQNPTKNYTLGAPYSVTLTATNIVGSHSASDTVNIYSPPVVDFSATPRSGLAPVTIVFSDLSTGNVTGWDWDFGDASAHSSSRNPTHQYTVPGRYSVTLIATNPAGTNTRIKANYICAMDKAAELEITQDKDASGHIILKVNIKRVKNISTGATVTPSGGIGAYDASATYSAAGVSIVDGRGVSPFDAVTFNRNTAGGTKTLFNAFQVSAEPQPPLNVAHLLPSLIGTRDNSYSVTLNFTMIAAGSGEEIYPESTVSIDNLRRGNAKDTDGVDIGDAMFIAQYLAGLRDLGTGVSAVNPLNGASVKHDTGGELITIADALVVAQMLVGLRDTGYNLIT